MVCQRIFCSTTFLLSCWTCQAKRYRLRQFVQGDAEGFSDFLDFLDFFPAPYPPKAAPITNVQSKSFLNMILGLGKMKTEHDNPQSTGERAL